MKRTHRVTRRCVALSTIVTLAVCTGSPGHVLAASRADQTPATGEPTATTTAPATTTPTASAGATELGAQARERFKAKDYDAAVRLFEQAHALDPNPNYLFNIGRVYEEKRDLRGAVDYYQRFVMEPTVEIGAREQAVQRLRVLKAILNETDPNPSSAAAPGTTTTTEGPAPGTPSEPAAPPSDRKKTMRLGGYALLGAGGVAMIVGGVFGGLTLAKRNELDASHMVDERRSLKHTGETFAIVSDVALFSGAALAVTGLVLVLVARKPRGPSRSAVLPSVGRGHAGLTWSVRF